MIRLFTAFLFIYSFHHLGAQEHYPINGLIDHYQGLVAITNAKIHVSSSKIIERGTLLVKKGKIIGLGTPTIPKGSIIYDMSGKELYPSFIDIYSGFGIQKKGNENKLGFSLRSQHYYESEKEGSYYWNEHIKPEINAYHWLKFSEQSAKGFRESGFGVVSSHVQDGIARGTSALIALSNRPDQVRTLSKKSAQHFSFDRSLKVKQTYPSSLMGVIALLKQLELDAQWYHKKRPFTDISLDAYLENRSLPQIIDVEGKLNVLRALNINPNYIVKGSGNSYEAASDIASKKVRLIVPVNFPKPFEIQDPLKADQITLRQLRYWNQAPKNPSILEESGISFAFTLSGLKDKADFIKNIRTAISFGLSEKKALDALTTHPAELIGKSSVLGTLEKGKWANLLVTNGPIFDSKTKILENWVQGDRFVFVPEQEQDVTGEYLLNALGKSFSMRIEGDKRSPTAKVEDKKATFKIDNKYATLSFYSAQGMYRLQGSWDGSSFEGVGVGPNGESIHWVATRGKPIEDKKEKEKDISKEIRKVMPVTYPNAAFGFSSLPEQESIVFRNATVWTNEEEGILKEADLWIEKGKIKAVGKNINAPAAKQIDATGKHITPGIIDEHSHIASVSYNEVGQAITAEVDMSETLVPDHIAIYRQLAGGVTTSQILHGSANPIGGQSAIIKLRWGENAEGLKFREAPKFIKFALGENVKQSNWPIDIKTRYPQTRMGVEQLFYDAFYRAKAYLNNTDKHKRKDLELETLSEILKGDRHITCHSYIASEILMLMSVADSMGFKVSTFTHILEGYKVAEQMRKHGAYGSTFSDWWAYKFEVNDAIPYNGALMHRAGILTAFNSDDQEMGRRLNQEAAKAVKYGNISQEDALKFVTLNPAKMLRIDHLVGSLKKGKHADIVLWSGHPLSIYTKAEQTYVDGKLYFDIKRNEQFNKAIAIEKNEIIQQMLKAKSNGEETTQLEEKK